MSVLSGAVALALGSAVAEKVCFETARETVRMELDMYVDQFGFIDLFEFVVNMGRIIVYPSPVAGVWEQVRRPKSAPAGLSCVC